MDFLANAIWSVIPTILIGGLFGLILRGAITADRTERRTFAQIEREERERAGLPPKAATARPAAADDATA